MGVAVERDVGDRVAIGHGERARREVVVEELQDASRCFSPADSLGVIGCPATHEQTEAEAADRGNDVRLLEDQPPHDLRQLERIVGKEIRPVREVERIALDSGR